MLKTLAAVLVALIGIGVGTSLAQDVSPCALVTAEEGAAALGASLAVPPFPTDGTAPTADGSLCRFVDEDFRSVDLRVVWHGGKDEFTAMNILGKVLSSSEIGDLLKLIEGAGTTGEWDDARRIGCCEFAALKGQTLVGVAFGSPDGLARAVALTNSALRRLAAPLAFDAEASLAAATALEAKRPAPRPACDLISRARVEEILGAKLTADPAGDESSCTWIWNDPKGGYEQQLKLVVTWRGGFAEFAFVQDAIGMASTMLSDQGLKVKTEAESGAADAQVSTFINEMAVENDVLLNIETGGGFMSGVAKKLIAEAVASLKAG